MPEGE
jgi:ribonuclease D